MQASEYQADTGAQLPGSVAAQTGTQGSTQTGTQSNTQRSTQTGRNISDSEVVSTRQLVKHFGKFQAVNGIDLNIGRGHIYGFLGPNGAGKTTTIRMLLGLIRPSAGNIRLFGEAISSRVFGKIGALVETPSAYNHLTGGENLEVTRRMLAAPRGNVERVLELVGLKDAAGRVVRGYSLGMKGRLSIAAALLNDPQLLILDEPTNGLDPQGVREIRELVQSLPERGITVLVSSHLLTEIELMATHVGIIVGGRMRFEGSLDQLRSMSQPRGLVRVDRPQQALDLLARRGITARIGDAEAGGLEFNQVSQAAAVNRALIEAGLEVSGLTVKRESLEDLFLELTGGA